jgi:hypothetical protein
MLLFNALDNVREPTAENDYHRRIFKPAAWNGAAPAADAARAKRLNRCTRTSTAR